jgi:hypothetical protein
VVVVAGGVDLGRLLTELMAEGASVVLSSGDAANRPVVGRALDCRLVEGLRVSVTIDRAACRAVLAAVQETGRIAVTVTRPSTHRCVQIKGTDALAVPVTEGDRADLPIHIDSFVRDVADIGFEEPLIRALMHHDPDDLATLLFTPSAVFDQTPGPRAGSPLTP